MGIDIQQTRDSDIESLMNQLRFFFGAGGVGRCERQRIAAQRIEQQRVAQQRVAAGELQQQRILRQQRAAQRVEPKQRAVDGRAQ